jgi:catechol 2,3-dioxygenase-like lactoylglutathione lyase family enzyme
MEPRVHVITLAVEDLDRALAFYREGLGFDSPGVVATELHDEESGADGAIAAFTLRDGLILSLYRRRDLAKDAGVPMAPAKTGELSLGHLVAERAEVDAVIEQARSAGACVLGQPRDRPWGIYSGYFQDPDGHLWEVIHNPSMGPAAGDP